MYSNGSFSKASSKAFTPLTRGTTSKESSTQTYEEEFQFLEAYFRHKSSDNEVAGEYCHSSSCSAVKNHRKQKASRTTQTPSKSNPIIHNVPRGHLKDGKGDNDIQRLLDTCKCNANRKVKEQRPQNSVRRYGMLF